MANSNSSPLKVPAGAKFTRKLWAAFLLAFMASIGLIVFAPRLLDEEALRVRLLTQIGHWSGGEMTSSGGLELSLFPRFIVTLSDVASKNSGAPIQISAQKIEIELSFWHAMFGEIESSAVEFNQADIVFKNVSLESARALLTKNPLGKSFAFAANLMEADATHPDLSSMSNNRLGTLTLIQSSVTIFGANGKTERLSQVNGSLNWSDIGSHAVLEAEANWRSEPVKIDAQVKKPLLFMAGESSEINLNFSAAPMTLSFQGSANLVSNFFAEGSVAWKTPSMDRFLNWTKADTAAVKSDSEIELKAKLVTKDGKLFFNDVAMVFSGNTATGVLEINTKVRPIKSSGTLAFKSVDLSAIAASLPIGMSDKNSSELHLLDALDLDLRLSAEQATIAGYAVANVAGAIRIVKGDASIDVGTGEIAGGTVKGRLELAGPAMAKTGRLSAGISNINQDQLTDLPEGIPILSGPVAGKFDIAGPYSNFKSLFATGDGTFTLESDVGVIRNFNLASMQTAMDQQSVFELPTVYAGMSEARAFNVAADVKNGVIVIKSANATIDGRRVTFSGSLPLLSRNIALNGVIANAESTQSQKQLTFAIGGTWSKPLVTNLSRN